MRFIFRAERADAVEQINTDPGNQSELRATLGAIQRGLDHAAEFATTVVSESDFDSVTAVGAPVYASGSGTVELANASALSTSHVVGLAQEVVASGGDAGVLATVGFVDSDDWTAVIGSIDLTAGSKYYLATTAGMLTTTAPSTIGQCVVAIGRALTARRLELQIQFPILL